MPNAKEFFDFQTAVDALRTGSNLGGEESVFTPFIKQLTEASIQDELEQYLVASDQPNRRNGIAKKTIKTSQGDFELSVPRDRTGTFEPQIIEKSQTYLTD